MARELGSVEHTPMGGSISSAERFFELGMLYAVGLEVESDLVAAHKWFNLAAVSGNAEAAYHRQEIAREMSTAEVSEAQRAAREWLRAH